MKAAQLVTGENGIATSLLEAALVIAIVAVLSSIALVAAIRHIEDARLSRAMADAQIVGISIHSFMHDTGFAPVFKNGNARGPEDQMFLVLQSDGSDPEVDSSLHWPAEANARDRLENQLMKNQPGGTGASRRFESPDSKTSQPNRSSCATGARLRVVVRRSRSSGGSSPRRRRSRRAGRTSQTSQRTPE